MQGFPDSEAPNPEPRTPKGFTLIEVLVVVFILGILAAIVAPKMLGRTDDAKIAETKLQMKNLETALKLYKLDSGMYPTTDQGLEALITKPDTEPIPKKYKDDGYLEKTKIPKDAWGNPYLYLSPGTHGDFDIISYGSDGKPGGEGKDADIKSWEIGVIRTCIQNDNKAARRKRRRHTVGYVEELTTKPTQVAFECDFV